MHSHLSIEERHKKHPIFWVLLDQNRAQKLAQNLDTICGKTDKINRIIRKLKSSTDEFNFHSLISEIEVLAYYYNKVTENYKVFYEPRVEKKNKKIDGRLTINGTDYNLEILTVFEDEEGQSIHSAHEEIRKQLDSIEGNNFILSFSTEKNFSLQDIPGFVEFVKKLLERKTIVHKDTFVFRKENKPVAKITFYKDPKVNRGFVGFMNQPVRFLDCAGRIKNKILSKVDQLPNNSKNIVIVNLSHITNDFIDLEEVFLGQSCVQIDIKTHEAKSARHPNSIVNHPKGKNISMVVGYVNENYNSRRFYINLSADKPVDKELIEKIF